MPHMVRPPITRRRAKVGASQPSSADKRVFIHAIGWAIFGGFAGQLIQSLPTMTSVCGAIGTGFLLALSNAWHLLRGGLRVVCAVITGVIVVVCIYTGVREYTGASYSLGYEACGAPTFSNGYLDGITFGIEWVNLNKKSLWTHLDKHELDAEDRRSKLPAPDVTVEVKPQQLGQGNGKLDDRVDFDPPLTPKESLTGRVHQEYKVGPDKEHLRRTYVIDGFFELQLIETPEGPQYQFRYSPTSKGSSGFSGYCDIDSHLSAQSVPQV